MATDATIPHWEYQKHQARATTGQVAVPYSKSGSSPFRAVSSTQIVPGAPALTDEAIGWLTYQNRRATEFGGTWRKEDLVHAAWDNHSGEPIDNYFRYDLTFSTFALALMADQTPAWRELYGSLLDFLAQRFLEYWTFFDWVERRGPDPHRDEYPDWWYEVLIPAGYKGKYDSPGWVSNGIEPYEYDPDPVRANGSCNAMYKGFMNTVVGLYTYISGDDKYDSPFKIVYDDSLTFEYDYVGLSELIAEQFTNNYTGISCEVTKSFGFCNNLSGLGLRLFDITHGTQLVEAYHNFRRWYRANWMTGGAGSGPIEACTLYYDKTIDVNLNDEQHQFAHNYSMTGWIGAPHDQDLHRRLYEGGMARFFRPQPDGSAYVTGMPGMEIDFHVATAGAFAASAEFGDRERHAQLRSWIQRNHQPTWDADAGEFYLHFGLDEPWPRAQLNDWAMLGYTTTAPGQWHDLFVKPNLDKFRQPTVTGVDFPTVRPRQACYDTKERALCVSLTSCDRDRLGDPTSFVVTNLAPGATYRLTVDGATVSEGQPADGTLTVNTRVGNHAIVLRQMP